MLGPNSIVRDTGTIKYTPIVQAAVSELNAAGDTKVYYHQFEYATGSSGHPSCWFHENLQAPSLLPVIMEKTGWTLDSPPPPPEEETPGTHTPGTHEVCRLTGQPIGLFTLGMTLALSFRRRKKRTL